MALVLSIGLIGPMVAAFAPARPYEGPQAVRAEDAAPEAVDGPQPEPGPERVPVRPRSSAPPMGDTPHADRDGGDGRILRPTMLGEVDVRGVSDEVEGNTGFAIGRFRMGLRFEPRAWVTAVGTAEWVGDLPYLLDGYAVLRPARWIEIGVGYAKPPLFPSFRHEPVVTLPTPDRSPVVTGFRVRRDVGAELRLVPRRAPIEAIVRLGNGQTGLANDNATPAGYGALDLVLGRAWTSGRNRRLGLRLGAAGMIDDAAPRTGIGGQNAVGYAFFPGPPIRGLRVVGEAHAIAYAGPVRTTVEAAIARETVAVDDDGDPETPTSEGDFMDSYGITGELAWVVLGRPREVGQAPAPRGEGRWSGGALELAGRVDRVALGRNTPFVDPNGATGGALSIKWFATDFLATTLAGFVMRYDAAPTDSPNRTLSWSIFLRLSVWWSGRKLRKTPQRPRR
jgi:phosphate-selective porin OprO/OprP